jgi:hypothetical protein
VGRLSSKLADEKTAHSARDYTRNFLVHILRRAFLCAKDWQHGRWRNDRIVRAGALGPDAVELMALADRSFARRDMDS